jgi:uncharacterized protein YcbX
MAAESDPPEVVRLNIFPLKSGKAVQVDQLDVDKYGVVGDRNFMLVDGTTNRFLSQRKIPKMALITAEHLDMKEKKSVKFSAAGMSDLVVHPTIEGKIREVGIWNQTAPAVDQGDEPAEWFAKFLGPAATYARLVYYIIDDPLSRPIRYLPDSFKKALGHLRVSFQDEAPVTVISYESLGDLNSKMKERVGFEVPMNRFRMNIEVKGCKKAFEEDEWLAVKIGDSPFMVYENAERCKLTSVDQETGEIDKFGPIDMLRTYRAPRGPGHACFGRKLVPLNSTCRIAVGDKVEVIERVK